MDTGSKHRKSPTVLFADKPTPPPPSQNTLRTGCKYKPVAYTQPWRTDVYSGAITRFAACCFLFADRILYTVILYETPLKEVGKLSIAEKNTMPFFNSVMAHYKNQGCKS